MRKYTCICLHLFYYGGPQKVGSRSWSRYVQLCTCQLTVQRTTLVGAFEIGFRIIVYKRHETRETLTLTVTVIRNPNTNTNLYGKLFESDYNDYWHASFCCTVSQQAHICTYLDNDLVGTITKMPNYLSKFITSVAFRISARKIS